MTTLTRKLSIIASNNGIILQPHQPPPSPVAKAVHIKPEPNCATTSTSSSSNHQLSSPSSSSSLRNHSHLQGVQIDYCTQRIHSLEGKSGGASSHHHHHTQRYEGASIESDGVVGLLSLASHSFLLAITQTEEVARLFDTPVYVISDIAVIPLSSQAEAEKAINGALRDHPVSLKKANDRYGNEDDNDVDGNDSTSEDNNDGSGRSDDSNTDDDDDDMEGEKQRDIDEGDGVSKEDGSNARPSTSSQDTGSPLEIPSGVLDKLTSAVDIDQPQGVSPTTKTSANIAEDVFAKKPRYLKFASRWFTRNGWASDISDNHNSSFHANASASPGLSESVPREEARDGRGSSPHAVELDGLTPDAEKKPRSASVFSQGSQNDRLAEGPLTKAIPTLLPKLLKYTMMILSSRNFYFSYDYDLTRKLAVHDSSHNSVPLFRRADTEFFWNRHMTQPFVEQGHHSFVLPLIQGFVGQKEIPVQRIDQEQTGVDDDEQSQLTQYLVTLISRRSVKRPGVRYLRRGVDDDGNVANMVETEQIVSHPDWDPCQKVYSFLLFRGSIPLYFSQTPYSLKPTPVLRDSSGANRTSFDLHMQALSKKYGKIQAVCLADKDGVEKPIGGKYQEFAQDFNERGQKLAGKPLGFKWFDFHHECRGMRFENVSRLVDSLTETIDCYGWSIYQDNAVCRTQGGIFRINCIDCLDRTGVVQTAFGQYVLQRQLESEGYMVSPESSEFATNFNTLWADNGDAISKQYSSTAALKGDYTRTGKRNVRGALNDFGLTLSRYFNNAVIDFFSQACIDYLLGNVSERVFDEFETKMMSTDPGISLERVHQNAIDICSRTVLESKVPPDFEEFVGGWVVLCPSEPNTLRSQPFYQCILLLTNAAVYCCKYDWNTDKVTGIRRVDVENISEITYGTYITSTLTQLEMDTARNVGIIISHKTGTGTPDSSDFSSSPCNIDESGEAEENGSSPPGRQSQPQSSRRHKEWDFLSFFQSNRRRSSSFLAFKILPCSMSVAKNDSILQDVSAKDTARMVCEEVERMAMARRKSGCIGDPEDSIEKEQKGLKIREAEIISLEEARKRTGILEVLAFDLKRLVWA